MIESMIAERMGRLGTETAFEVLARARALERQGKSVVHLEIGEPDFDTPAHIREAAKRALDAGATHYGPSAGLPELREAIAEDIEKTRGVPVAPDEVVVTPGAKPIMFFVIMALTNRGDEVIYPNPGFPIYESVINFVGGVPVPIPLREETGFGFDLAGARAARLEEDQAHHHQLARRTRRAACSSPEDVGRIADLARHFRVPVLSDEIYRRFLYDGEFASIASLPGMKPQTIILDGFSKSYAMTGWRLGFGVMPKPLGRAPHAPHDELRVLHGDLHPACGPGRDPGRRHPGAGDGGGVPPAARPRRRRAEPDPRGLLRAPSRRLLRLPEREVVRAPLEGDRHPPPRAGRAWRSWAGPRSASTARGTCASPTRRRGTRSARPFAGSPRGSSSSPERGGPLA